jgi:hypothetical protein
MLTLIQQNDKDMQELIASGFRFVKTEKGTTTGYPNDVHFYHRDIKGVAYQEVRVDFIQDKLAFENNFGNLTVFKIWLGIKQSISQDNLEIKFYA